MRFISQDPVDNVNLYNYSNNNPVNMFDPTGAMEEDDEGGGPSANNVDGDLPILQREQARGEATFGKLSVKNIPKMSKQEN